MPPRIPERELHAIEEVVCHHPEGSAAGQIAHAIGTRLPRRTLQYYLRHLVSEKRLVKKGKGRWTRYLPARGMISKKSGTGKEIMPAPPEAAAGMPLSEAGREILDLVSRPMTERKPVGYRRDFLENYLANKSSYLSSDEKTRLQKLGEPGTPDMRSAGTYAERILHRLLIDLSWNSSRLEGNTYSLLETRRLIELGEETEGKAPLEAQMILNHKAAIEFLVQSAGTVGFNRQTICNLHAMLADNLLGDPSAPGRLRREPVTIGLSVYRPPAVPQIIDECFDRLLATARAIRDPFEQAFFVMVQLPYLQPFLDVNKRVSRLAANIPLIRNNLVPLSFVAVSDTLYVKGLLGVYEHNRIDLLKDVFLWAYERSAVRYAAVQQSIIEPDAFRLQHRDAIKEAIANVIQKAMGYKTAAIYLKEFAADRIGKKDRNKFIEAVETDLTGVHEGSYARYRLRPSEFQAWRKVWDSERSRTKPFRTE